MDRNIQKKLPSLSISDRWEHERAIKECTQAVTTLEQALRDKEVTSAFIKQIPDAIQQELDEKALRESGEYCIS